MSRFIDRVIEDSIPIWNDCMNTPFVKELWNGTLSKDRFKKYIIEDSLYLREYARGFAYAMTKAKTMDEMKFYYSVLSFVNESETSIRVKYLKQFNLKESKVETYKPQPYNQKYINHMIEDADKKDIKEVIMSLLPCVLSYSYIFSNLNKKTPFNDEYKDLLQEYILDSYEEECIMWCNFADKLLSNTSKDEEEKLTLIFRKSSEYELGFWNGCYEV